MAAIAIQTQPSDTTVAEFGTATFTTVLSGSSADTVSYLTSSNQWFNSSSLTAISNATASTLTLTNVQEGQNGIRYFMTAHSASAAGTAVTSSIVTLRVASEPEFQNVDQDKTANARYEHLGVKTGYKVFIPLVLSGSEMDERYCPHFQSKRDMRQFISHEVGRMNQIITSSTQQASRSYNGVWIAESQLGSYSHIGDSGYKVFIPLYFSGSQVLERYCPHFETEHDVQQFIDKQIEIGTFNQVLG